MSSVREREKKQQKKYGKSTRDRDDIYGHSEDELGKSSLSHESGKHDYVDEGVQDDQSPLEDSAAASRVNAMLDSYGGAESPDFGTGGFGGHFRVETSIQKISTPAIVIAARSQQSNPSTWPTMPNTTPTKSTSTDQSFGNSFGTNDFLNDENGEREVVNYQIPSQNPESNNLDKPTSSTKDDSGQADIQEELSLPDAEASNSKPSKPSQKQSTRQSAAADELGSEDPAIDLPKDQYQPRPSRSRGTHNDDDLIIPENFSKRPEDLVKGKRKVKNRRKTTALEKPTPKIELDDEDENEAKVPLTSIPKLWPRLKGWYPYDNETDWEDFQKKNPGQAAAVDQQWKHHGAKQDELISKQAQADPSPKKRGRGRPKKQDTQPTENTDDQELEKDHDIAQDAAKTPPVQEEGNKSNLPIEETPAGEHLDENSADDEEPTKLSRKRKASALQVLSDSENEVHTDIPVHEEPAPTAPKPRGRKKRKTDDATAVVDSDYEAIVTDATQSTKAPPKKRGRKKKSELHPVSAPTILPDDDEDPLQPGNEETATDQPPKILSQSKDSNTKVPPPPASPTKLTTPPTTPAKTAKPVHSPLNSSQVKFRVGLSKRARIAPLLKIVRK